MSNRTDEVKVRRDKIKALFEKEFPNMRGQPGRYDFDIFWNYDDEDVQFRFLWFMNGYDAKERE